MFNRSNVITLSHEVKVIVPSTKDVNVNADSSAMVDFVAGEFSKLNGGATITSGQGTWNSDKMGLVKEAVTVVSSSCVEVTDEVLACVYSIAQKILAEMSQEAVSVSVDGILYLVFPE